MAGGDVDYFVVAVVDEGFSEFWTNGEVYGSVVVVGEVVAAEASGNGLVEGAEGELDGSSHCAEVKVVWGDVG